MTPNRELPRKLRSCPVANWIEEPSSICAGKDSEGGCTGAAETLLREGRTIWPAAAATAASTSIVPSPAATSIKEHPGEQSTDQGHVGK